MIEQVKTSVTDGTHSPLSQQNMIADAMRHKLQKQSTFAIEKAVTRLCSEYNGNECNKKDRKMERKPVGGQCARDKPVQNRLMSWPRDSITAPPSSARPHHDHNNLPLAKYDRTRKTAPSPCHPVLNMPLVTAAEHRWGDPPVPALFLYPPI